MRTHRTMRMRRGVRWKKKLAAVLAAGVCFQTAQCAIDPNQLGVELVQTVGTLFITDYIYHVFNVQPTLF